MSISKLHIENFRSIQGPFDLELSQINALVGQNNSGKSNVILALQRISGPWLSVNTFSEDDVYLRDPNRNIKISIDLDPPFEYSPAKYAPAVKIKTLVFEYTHYKTGEREGQRRLDKTCFDSKGKIPQVLARPPKKGEQHEFKPVIGIPQEVLDALPIIAIGSNRELKDQLPYSRNSLLRKLLEDIDADFRNPKNVVAISDKDGKVISVPRCDRFMKFMEQAVELLHTDEFTSLEKTIKENALRQLGFDPAKDTGKLDFYFSPFSSIDFYKSLKLFVKEGNFNIEATELGGGIQNALVIAILKAFEERRKRGAIFLIEEPELFLHPQMQRSLYKSLREIGKTNQLIYTTHSPHFVAIPEYNEVVLISKNEQGTYRKISDLPIDAVRREKIRKEFDPERNELFFAKKLLLVEGDTEKLSIPEYALKKKLDLDNAGITIVEVGGKRSLLEFAKIAISFDIPTGIVYDEDSSCFSDKEKKQEAEYNAELEKLEKKDGTVKAWKLIKDYEDEIKKSLGSDVYQKLCQKYPNHSKPIRQKLVACDVESKVPKFVQTILDWVVK